MKKVAEGAVNQQPLISEIVLRRCLSGSRFHNEKKFEAASGHGDSSDLQKIRVVKTRKLTKRGFSLQLLTKREKVNSY